MSCNIYLSHHRRPGHMCFRDLSIPSAITCVMQFQALLCLFLAEAPTRHPLRDAWSGVINSLLIFQWQQKTFLIFLFSQPHYKLCCVCVTESSLSWLVFLCIRLYGHHTISIKWFIVLFNAVLLLCDRQQIKRIGFSKY